MKFLNYPVIVIIGTACLTGCGATAGVIGKLPEVVDQARASQVVVYRPYNGFNAVANNYTLAVDGIDAFGIASKSNVRFTVEAGKHTLTIKCFGGLTPTTKEDSVTFVATPKVTSYFEVNTASSFSKCATIEEIDEVIGFNRASDTTKLTK